MVLTIIANPMQSSAAYSKVATKVATKVAKEYVQDSAVQMAMEIAFNYEMSQMMADEFDNPDDGYKAACLPKTDGKKDLACSKPVQVKVPTTETDKKILADKVEEVLERKTGMNGWKKFLDWFVPIFLVSGVVSWITTKLDSEQEDLFDDVAKTALEETGGIKELKKKNPVGVTDGEGNPIPPDRTPESTTPVPTGTVNVPTDVLKKNTEYDFSNNGKTSTNIEFDMTGMPIVNTGIVIDIAHGRETSMNNIYNNVNLTVANTLYTSGSLTSARKMFFFGSDTAYWGHVGGEYGIKNEFQIDGVRKMGYSSSSMTYYDIGQPYIDNFRNVKRIVVELAKPTAWGYAHRVHYITKTNTVQTFQFDFKTFKDGITSLNGKFSFGLTHAALTGVDMKVRLQYFENFTGLTLTQYKPKLDDVVLSPTDYSNYKLDNGVSTFIPPTAVPIKTPEGIPVKPSQDSTTGWIDITTGEEITVDEETLIVEDPVKTPDGIQVPDGEDLPTPEPTKPEPIPDDISEEDFEDLSCAKPKKPDFKPIGESFTTSFPFSIPWDIKRFIDNAFGGVGDERPTFTLSFISEDTVLEIPEYFDSWVAFGKAFVVIAFDISILYLFYRFMKGGGD